MPAHHVVVIRRLSDLVPFAQKYFADKILDVFGGPVDPAYVDIDFRLYGDGAVLAASEPQSLRPRELGVLMTVTAPPASLRDVPVQSVIGEHDTSTAELAPPDARHPAPMGDSRIERIHALRANWRQHGIDARLDAVPDTAW